MINNLYTSASDQILLCGSIVIGRRRRFIDWDDNKTRLSGLENNNSTRRRVWECRCWAGEMKCHRFALIVSYEVTTFSEAMTENSSILRKPFFPPEILATYGSLLNVILKFLSKIHLPKRSCYFVIKLGKSFFFKVSNSFFRTTPDKTITNLHLWKMRWWTKLFINFVSAPRRVTHNCLFIALRCTLLCGCECLFSMCITHMECISDPGTYRNCRTDVFSHANWTESHKPACLSKRKNTPSRGWGWRWEIKWQSAVCQSSGVPAVSHQPPFIFFVCVEILTTTCIL